MEEFINVLKTKDLGLIKYNEPLSKYTTYKVGGNAKVVAFPKDILCLKKLLKLIKQYCIKYKVIGNGSNLLFSSKEYDGIIIILSYLNKISINNNQLICESGASSISAAMKASNSGLSGLEFLTGIPGSIGGTVYMNAGAYGNDIQSVINSIKVLNNNLEIVTLTKDMLDFCYRKSILQDKDYICLEATFNLKSTNKDIILNKINEYKIKRKNSQPLEYPSAGSVFRNPTNNYAGKLIEETGLKGMKIGGAEVSTKHANFIINFNNATSLDYLLLMQNMQNAVYEKFNVKLEPEIIYAGDDKKEAEIWKNLIQK